MLDERVVFRIEKNPYAGGTGYLAVFPEDDARPGHIACTPFYFENGRPVFEPFTEMSLEYYYHTKPVHKNSRKAEQCLTAITEYYHCRFEVGEKINRGRRVSYGPRMEKH